MGILLAFTALLSWGLGDFLIQRSVKKFGDWIALFYITAFGSIVLFPFVYHNIVAALSIHAALLVLAAFVLLAVALLDFEAFRIGKISIVEPMYALEIPTVAILSTYIIHEHLSVPQIVFITTLVIGIFLVSIRSFDYFKNFKPEKGIWYALIGAVGMGATNFLFGIGSREISPLMINWFTDVFITLAALIYLISSSQLKKAVDNFKQNKRLILNVSFFDKLAWVTFSYATLYIPIAIASGISEGYIALAVGLGLLFNAEKLKRHQWIGFVIVAISVIILALLTDK
jgi:drug/metabolite transporter (DMT)-like permease